MKKPLDGSKPLNPKDALAALTKVPMHLLPAIGQVHGAISAGGGAIDYGPYNWREVPIQLMEYIGALERHITGLKDGEWYANEKPGKPLQTHLGCIIATASIILDAEACGTLIDNRPEKPGGAPAVLARFGKERNDDTKGSSNDLAGRKGSPEATLRNAKRRGKGRR